MPWLSRETEEEIDGIIQCQEEEPAEDKDKRNRTGTLRNLRRGSLPKKQHDAVSLPGSCKIFSDNAQLYLCAISLDQALLMSHKKVHSSDNE